MHLYWPKVNGLQETISLWEVYDNEKMRLVFVYSCPLSNETCLASFAYYQPPQSFATRTPWPFPRSPALSEQVLVTLSQHNFIPHDISHGSDWVQSLPSQTDTRLDISYLRPDLNHQQPMVQSDSWGVCCSFRISTKLALWLHKSFQDVERAVSDWHRSCSVNYGALAS